MSSITLSVTPSLRYRFSGTPVELANGRTAIEGLPASTACNGCRNRKNVELPAPSMMSTIAVSDRSRRVIVFLENTGEEAGGVSTPGLPAVEFGAAGGVAAGRASVKSSAIFLTAASRRVTGTKKR